MRAVRPRVLMWQWTLGAFLLLVGFLSVLQFRAGRALRQETELPTVRVKDLAVLVQRQETALRGLQAEIEVLRGRLLEYETAAAQGRSAAQTLAKEVTFYQLVLGLVPLHGGGVIVRLRELGAPGGVVTSVVQAPDVSALVNELWSAGAEAMAVNGMRILATTGFRQDRQGILVGSSRLKGPYQIQALGDPGAMVATLNLRGGFVEGLRSVGLAVEVSKFDDLTLPAYSEPLRFRLAAPASP